jgi:hypothetical protein
MAYPAAIRNTADKITTMVLREPESVAAVIPSSHTMCPSSRPPTPAMTTDLTEPGSIALGLKS